MLDRSAVPELHPAIEAEASAPPHSVRPAAAPRRSVAERLRRAVAREFAALHPRLLVAGAAAASLPHLAFPALRTALYRTAGISIGRRTMIAGPLHLIGHGPIQQRLRIGSHCFLTGPLFASLDGEITIGDGVTVGHHAVLITADHEIGPAEERAGAVRPSPIVIEDGAWLAARVTVLPGARIGAGTVIGAGSVVRGEIPPGVLAAGTPARVLRRIDAPRSLSDP